MDSTKAELQQQMQPPLPHYYNADGKLKSPSPHQAVDGSDVWMTAAASEPRRQSKTIHQRIPACADDGCSTIPSWGSYSLQPDHEDPASRSASMQQGLLSLDMNNGGHWTQKSCQESLELQGLEVDGQDYTTDETVSIIDLRYSNSPQQEQIVNLDGSLNRRRVSGSSLTISVPVSDLPPHDDMALSEAPSYGSDYHATSKRGSEISSTRMSPAPSPRITSYNRPEQVKPYSGGRATPSPRTSMRSAPYSMQAIRGQQWSTGSYDQAQNQRHLYNGPSDVYGMPSQVPYQEPPPTPFPAQQPPLMHGGFQGAPRAPFMMAGQPMYPRSGMLLSSHMPPQPLHPDTHDYEQPPPLLPSQGLLKMLQSNGGGHALPENYTDLSDPPNLSASLHEKQIPPPEEDMNPSDPDMIPYEQELRFEGDLYTPRWVRGHGNKREGWCGICKPGRWLVLKNSAFWYDKSFTHGISAATGAPFQEPLDKRRMDGNPDVWEGLCGSCHDWVALVSNKKKGTTWFRHAYKCHSHPKVKDGSKRHRDANNSRAQATQGSRAKSGTQRPESPDTGSTHTSRMSTPTSATMPHFRLQPRIVPQAPPMPAPGPLHQIPGSLAIVTDGLGNIA